MTDSDGNVYFLGGRPPAASKPAKQAPPRDEPRPVVSTYWKTTGAKYPVLVNPNLCMICHKPPHRPLPHHGFIPDEAFAPTAKAMGWPLPEPDELPGLETSKDLT